MITDNLIDMSLFKDDFHGEGIGLNCTEPRCLLHGCIEQIVDKNNYKCCCCVLTY